MPPRRLVPTPVDVVATIVLSGFVVGVTSGLAHWHGPHNPVAGPGIGAAGIIWLIAGVLPMLARRRFPLLAFLVSAALVISYYSSSYPGGPSAIVPVILLVSLAVNRGPMIAGGAGLAVVLSVFGLVLAGGGGYADPSMYGALVVACAAVAIGTAARTQRSARFANRARAEAEDRRRLEEERLRIAREVHDVVAHSLAMINVQAGVAAHVADRRPEQAKEALLAIKEASRTALADLRATLNVLRSGEGRAPTPGLHLMPDLIASASAAGLTVTVDGEANGLPAPVDVAAYRIVQESLTNVVRHAVGADTVRVTLEKTKDELWITVRDNGSTPESARGTGGSGNGLRGMAERTKALGGSASARRGGEGGFVVEARLPLNSTQQSTQESTGDPTGGVDHD